MVVELEAFIKAKIDEVWDAITNPKKMKKWYFSDMPDFKPEVGFKTKFVMHSDDRIFTANWLVTKVIPKRHITYNWSYDEYEGEGPVTFKLSPKKGGTLITIINEGLESFPQDIPEFKKESCLAGWEYFINGNLKKYFAETNT